MLPAAVPIPTTEVIVDTVAVPASLIVPPASATGLTPIVSTSSAAIDADAAATTRLNVSSLVPVPLAYVNECGPLPVPVPSLPLSTESVGVPVTSTASLNTTFADSVEPADTSCAVEIQSISVISAAPSAVVRLFIATSVSVLVLEPTTVFNSHPCGFADVFVFSASEAYLIKDGRISHPVKGATIIGNGPDILKQVSMVGNDMSLDSGVGTCGKDGQSVPVGVGQPTLKIDNIVVGGTN